MLAVGHFHRLLVQRLRLRHRRRGGRERCSPKPESQHAAIASEAAPDASEPTARTLASRPWRLTQSPGPELHLQPLGSSLSTGGGVGGAAATLGNLRISLRTIYGTNEESHFLSEHLTEFSVIGRVNS